MRIRYNNCSLTLELESVSLAHLFVSAPKRSHTLIALSVDRQTGIQQLRMCVGLIPKYKKTINISHDDT